MLSPERTMIQNNTLLRGLFMALVMGLYLVLNAQSSTWEPRLRPLEQIDVPANKDRLLRTGECRGCYLRRANFKNIDLTGMDYKGANLEGAIWTDGTVCQVGSVGTCVRPTPPPE